MARTDRMLATPDQVVALTFVQDALAANQSAVQLLLIEATAAPANTGITIPFDGEIIAVSYALTAAASAGQLTISATVDGEPVVATAQTVTTADDGYGRVARGRGSFSAGAQIGAEITTDGSWNGTAADLAVTIWVQVYVEGVG